MAQEELGAHLRRGPIQDAVLLVSHPDRMLERLAGLAVLERQLFTLARAGVCRVWIAARKPEDLRLRRMRWPEGLEVFWVSPSGDSPPPCRPPYAGISGDHVVRPETLRELLERPYESPVSYRDDREIGVVQVTPERGDRHIAPEVRPMPPASFAPLRTPADKGPALPWLLAQLRKKNDSFMARHFDRRLSLAVSKRLLDSPVHPNHMTVFSSLIGLGGALLMLGGSYGHMAAGALLVWLHTVLDGCDGELARLRFQESRVGGVLDFWGDNLVHFALFLCLGIGLFRGTGREVFLLLGAAAAVSAVGSAALVLRHSLHKAERADEGTPLFSGIADIGAEGGAPPSLTPSASAWGSGGGIRGRLARLQDILAQRDFVYLMVLLAAAGRMDVFLWAAGIGSPLFLFVLLVLRSRSRAA